MGALGLAVLPVCVGVAVLKYRLYAIDRIISRVISYAIVTAVLGGVFAGLVRPGQRGRCGLPARARVGLAPAEVTLRCRGR